MPGADAQAIARDQIHLARRRLDALDAGAVEHLRALPLQRVEQSLGQPVGIDTGGRRTDDRRRCAETKALQQFPRLQPFDVETVLRAQGELAAELAPMPG